MRSHRPIRAAGFLLIGVSLAACWESRYPDEELLARCPDGSVFHDLESAPPGRGRGLPECLRAQADVIGRGVCVPVPERKVPGGCVALREGIWTYEYVRTEHTIQPDGSTMTHFSDLDETSLGREARGEYVHDSLQGRWTYWHPNGNQRATGHFVDGEMTGAWEFWLENGAPDLEHTGIYWKSMRVGAR
jgi:hypothetical protein